MPGPPPSQKTGLETPSVPFQVRELLREQRESPGRLGFASHLHRGGRGGWQPAQREGLSPAPSTSPRRACGSRRATNIPASAGVAGGKNHGRANRKALSRRVPARPVCVPPAVGLQSAICRDFPWLPPGRAQASPSLPARPAAAAGPQEAAGHEQVAAGGQAGGEEVTVAKTYLFGGRRTDTRWPGRRKTKGGCLLQKGRKWSGMGNGETYWDWAGAFLS